MIFICKNALFDDAAVACALGKTPVGLASFSGFLSNSDIT